MRVLAVIETDLIEKGPHQTHHLLERISLRAHEVRIIDYEITWRRKRRNSLISKRIIIKNFSKATKNSKMILIRPRIVYIPLIDYVSEIFTYGKEIYRQIKDFNPDVIIGFSILNAYIAMKMAKRYRIPFIYYLIDAQHTQIPESFLRSLGMFVESQILRNADKILVINDELGRYAVKMGGSSDRVYVIRAGIDAARFNTNINGEEVREKFGIRKKKSR